jgi:hypothetical protein
MYFTAYPAGNGTSLCACGKIQVPRVPEMPQKLDGLRNNTTTYRFFSAFTLSSSNNAPLATSTPRYHHEHTI